MIWVCGKTNQKLCMSMSLKVHLQDDIKYAFKECKFVPYKSGSCFITNKDCARNLSFDLTWYADGVLILMGFIWDFDAAVADWRQVDAVNDGMNHHSEPWSGDSSLFQWWLCWSKGTRAFKDLLFIYFFFICHFFPSHRLTMWMVSCNSVKLFFFLVSMFSCVYFM